MGWPPKVGELLPRVDEAIGVREKLANYSLAMDHERGGPKAKGFQQMLGITLDSIEHLEGEIRAGIQRLPVNAIRANPPHGFNCVVEFPLRGVDSRGDTTVNLRTVWLLANRHAPPRLVSALLKP